MLKQFPDITWPTELVVVDWMDHWSRSRWSEPEEIPRGGMRCRTVGWLLREDDEVVQRYANASDNNTCDIVMTILKSTITSRVTLVARPTRRARRKR